MDSVSFISLFEKDEGSLKKKLPPQELSISCSPRIKPCWFVMTENEIHIFLHMCFDMCLFVTELCPTS